MAIDMAENTVFPHFNMERMSKRVLSKNWKTAEPKQRQRFMDEFRRLLLNTYARTIVEYSNETIEYLPFKAGKKENYVLIRTQVKPSTGQPIPIYYSMAFKDGMWKVIDVKIDGVSLVRNYRSTFTRDIQKNGLDNFLDRLAAKNNKKQGG